MADRAAAFIDRPLVGESAADDGIFTASSFSEILFGVLLVVFLMFAPDGLAGMIRKLRRRLAARSANRNGAAAASVSDD